MTIKQLKTKYGLKDEDFFTGDRRGVDDSYIIIEKSGIRKIAEKISLVVTSGDIKQSFDNTNQPYIAVVLTGESGGNTYIEVGEASPLNNSFSYPVSVAFKRARSRLTLLAAGIDKVMSTIELSSRLSIEELSLKEKISERVKANKRG